MTAESEKKYLRKALKTLSDDCADYWLDHRIPVFSIHQCSPVDFARDVYSRYHPCLLLGMTDHWPASELWTKEYLVNKLGDRKLAVNLTPDGRADSVQVVSVPQENGEILTTEHFVYPAEAEMSLHDFYILLESQNPNCIPYLSQQNDNLRQDLSELMDDIDLFVPIAQQVFGTDEPEAVNLWIGDERSVSSMHKDHFENLYFVLSGEKTFTLFPPTDVAFIPEKVYPTARYVASSTIEEELIEKGPWTLTLTSKEVPTPELCWTSLDPDDPMVNTQFPRFAKQTHPIRVTVSAGETLYIPSMWYHRVSQNELTVSVNFWYDQRFDFRYVFFKTVQSLLICSENSVDDDQVDDGTDGDTDGHFR
jgi:peptidyl-lysine (3S)-dioxygenase / protease